MSAQPASVPVDQWCTQPDFELVVAGTDPLRATIRASGSLDLSARDSIAELLGRQRDSGRLLVRLVLTDVTFVDCSCLRVLVEEHRRFLDARGQLVLTGVGPHTLRLLELTGLDQILFAVAGPPDLENAALGVRSTPDPLVTWDERPNASVEALVGDGY